MAPHAPLAVETEGLVVVLGGRCAAGGVDLHVPVGTVHGLVGPDGAGKTTTLRVLAAVQRPHAGRARVFGHDVVTDAAAVRSRVALTGQFTSLHAELSAADNLLLLARLLGYSRAAARQRADQLLAAFGLIGAGGRQVATYSPAMLRRLDVAASIVVRPDLILLDEPTTGLDPRGRREVEDVVRALVRGGTTVLLATPDLATAARLADRVSVLRAGRIVAECGPDARARAPGTTTGP